MLLAGLRDDVRAILVFVEVAAADAYEGGFYSGNGSVS